MYFIYILLNIFLYFLCLIALPFLSLKSKYNKFYLKLFPLKLAKKADIHFHYASFGEINALSPLIKELKKQGYTVLLTCASKTGYEAGKKIDDNCFFLPFEILLFFWLKKAKKLVVFEAELWLILSRIYKNSCILLNARISKKSFRKYYRFKFLYEKIFENYTMIYAQSNSDARRLKKLGAKNISVFTNIKIINPIKLKEKLKKNKELIIIASTHKGEEEIILNKLDKRFLKNKALIIAPRHPERFKQVYELIKDYAKKNNLSFSSFSVNKEAYLEKDIFLLDVLGKLVDFYAISDYVILGGSYIDNIGGHNFYEAAYFNNKIISGNYIFNQIQMLKYIKNIKISDDIDFSDVKNAFIKSDFTFVDLVNIVKG